MGNKRGGNKTQSYKVYKYDLKGNFIREFDSLADVIFFDELQKPHLIHHLQGKVEHYKKNIYSKNYYIKYPQELLPTFNKVYQYDLNGNYITEFENAGQAFRITGINNISDNLRGIKKQAGKFIWSYKKKEKIDPFIKPKNSKIKKLVQYDLKGKFIKIWDSSENASIELKINRQCILKVASREYSQTNKFIFRYYEGHNRNLPKSDIIIKSKKRPIIQYTLKGKKIKEFESISQATRETKIKTICDYFNGSQSHAGGFLWKYKN
jgi:hypothetical protein